MKNAKKQTYDLVPQGVKVQVLSSAPSLFKCLFQALLQTTSSIITKLQPKLFAKDISAYDLYLSTYFDLLLSLL